MPFKRKYSTYRSTIIKRKRMSRRASARQLRRRIRGTKYGFKIQPHLFHRWMTAFPSANVNVTGCTYNTSTSSLFTNVGQSTASFSMYFSLADIPNVSEFTTLFDYYKLNRVLVTIKMVSNPDASQQPTSQTLSNLMNYYPTIWYVRDNDDNNTVTLPAIKEFEKVRHKVLMPNREIKIILRPTTLSQIYKGVLPGYAIDTKKQYLDMAQADIPHYGLKTVFDLEGLTSSGDDVRQWQFKINAKYFFTCKSTR